MRIVEGMTMNHTEESEVERSVWCNVITVQQHSKLHVTDQSASRRRDTRQDTRVDRIDRRAVSWLIVKQASVSEVRTVEKRSARNNNSLTSFKISVIRRNAFEHLT